MREAHFYIALERCAYLVFGCLVAVGQTHGRHALRVLRPVLSSLFCGPWRGRFAFFCARFARCECLENHAGRGFQGSGLAPVSVLRFACTETGAGSHRAQRESKSRTAVLADCSVLMPMAFTRSSIVLCANVMEAAVMLLALGEQVRYLKKRAALSCEAMLQRFQNAADKARCWRFQ